MNYIYICDKITKILFLTLYKVNHTMIYVIEHKQQQNEYI